MPFANRPPCSNLLNAGALVRWSWGQRVHSGAADLRDKYLLALRAKPLLPEQLWRLFLEHPWYQREVKACGRLSLRRRHLPLQKLGDVQQDAMLRLLDRLQRLPHLNIDPHIGVRPFIRWLRRIVWKDCQAVTRRLQRALWRQLSFPRITCLKAKTNETQQTDDRLDVADLLEQLPERTRYVLQLYSASVPVSEIAQRLGLSQPQVYYYRHKGIVALRQRLLAAGWEMPTPQSPSE